MFRVKPDVGSYEYVAQEDRCAPRVEVSIPGYIRVVGGKRLATTTRNISLSGFAAIAVARLNIGAKCWLTLPNMESLEAEVVWWDRGIVGCSFRNLFTDSDLDAMIERWKTSDRKPRWGATE